MNDEAADRPKKPLALRGLRSFFVGGGSQRVELAASEPVALAMGSRSRNLEQSGDYQVGQMYVQGYLAAEPGPLGRESVRAQWSSGLDAASGPIAWASVCRRFEGWSGAH